MPTNSAEPGSGVGITTKPKFAKSKPVFASQLMVTAEGSKDEDWKVTVEGLKNEDWKMGKVPPPGLMIGWNVRPDAVVKSESRVLKS